MRRRELLLASAGLAVAGGARVAMDTPGDSPRVVFFVAGARFHSMTASLRVADLVSIVQERWSGGTRVAVLAANGSRLGFVPARLVEIVLQRGISSGILSRVDLHGVPWKRYEVTLG